MNIKRIKTIYKDIGDKNNTIINPIDELLGIIIFGGLFAFVFIFILALI